MVGYHIAGRYIRLVLVDTVDGKFETGGIELRRIRRKQQLVGFPELGMFNVFMTPDNQKILIGEENEIPKT